MGAFEWTEMYSVQVESFDRQHRTLFRTANELNEALRAGCGKDIVDRILQQLIDYAASHFAAEEVAMDRTGYPEFGAHQAEHKALVEQVLKFQEDFQAGKPGVAVALMQFLQKWLCHHIMQTDKKYGPFLNEKGIH
jgi:hemerythrin-like metal-binding protein